MFTFCQNGQFTLKVETFYFETFQLCFPWKKKVGKKVSSINLNKFFYTTMTNIGTIM